MASSSIGRWRLIVRDAGTASSAIENLHRCMAKIEERAKKLPRNPQGSPEDVAFLKRLFDTAEQQTEQAKLALGRALAVLDQVIASERDWWARVRRRTEEKPTAR